MNDWNFKCTLCGYEWLDRDRLILNNHGVPYHFKRTALARSGSTCPGTSMIARDEFAEWVSDVRKNAGLRD